uniref:Uncharacterized protein n=1 Tax=Opuntia streptacantha TaxID=393608 RepID=A0A7C9AC37_OPUST
MITLTRIEDLAGHLTVTKWPDQHLHPYWFDETATELCTYNLKNRALFIWNLDICSLTYDRNVSIHSTKSESHTIQHCEKVGKSQKCPEVHPNLAPVKSTWYPTAGNTNSSTPNLQQHRQHKVVSEEVGPFLPPHNEKVTNHKVSQESPLGQ